MSAILRRVGRAALSGGLFGAVYAFVFLVLDADKPIAREPWRHLALGALTFAALAALLSLFSAIRKKPGQ
jgi:hypothetical protein